MGTTISALIDGTSFNFKGPEDALSKLQECYKEIEGRDTQGNELSAYKIIKHLSKSDD